MRSVRVRCFSLGSSLLPTFAYAQTTLAGVVRDASGAVLPGVTVEASSSALIEKIRSAVTDGSGQYRITDLASGKLLSHLHAARLLEGRAGRADALRVGRDHGRCRVAPGRPGGNAHGHGRGAGRRRADDAAGNGAEQRGHPIAAGHAQLYGHHEQHRVADADRRRRRGDEPGPDQPLHGARRPTERRTHLGQRSAGDRAGVGRGRLVAGLRRGQRG